MESKKKIMKLLMSTKGQVKMYLPQDLIEELDRTALAHGKRSSQEIVAELITFYLPVWKVIQRNPEKAREFLRRLGDAVKSAA